MQRRHPLPRLWLMTDERLGEELMRAIARLPRGSGIVFRHYRLQPDARRTLFVDVRKAARRRRLLLLLAGTGREARAWRADGSHGRGRGGGGLRSAPAHDLREIRAADDPGRISSSCRRFMRRGAIPARARSGGAVSPAWPARADFRWWRSAGWMRGAAGR